MTMPSMFDYTNQAWTVGGIYVDCNHPATGSVMGVGSPAPGESFRGCNCYGRAHAGEPVPAKIIIEQLQHDVITFLDQFDEVPQQLVDEICQTIINYYR